jgi:enamine deaminase RidA (YjgF/YER057c/UK114 family)
VKKNDLVIPPSQRFMYDRFHFAPAVWSDELLLCSGQIGIGSDGRGIPATGGFDIRLPIGR